MAPVLQHYTKLDLEVIRHMHRTSFATSLDPGLVQPVLDAALAYKLLDRATAFGDLVAHL
jgi:hypothetical protein